MKMSMSHIRQIRFKITRSKANHKMRLYVRHFQLLLSFKA